MNRTLSDEDRRAVDLFLDQGAQPTSNAVTKVVPPVSQKRMSSVLKTLAVLDHMPVEEPPPNLIEKTMRKIDRASSKTAAHAPRRPAPVVRPA
jgi:hypothetical protein